MSRNKVNPIGEAQEWLNDILLSDICFMKVTYKYVFVIIIIIFYKRDWF